MDTHRISISFADEQDREQIYALRHEVYARELGQHKLNRRGRLTDALDLINVYIVAKMANEIVGFISITPPNDMGYSIDKYFAREDLDLKFDDSLYEARILTVAHPWRNSRVAGLLMYATLRYVESCGGRTIVSIGRVEFMEMYRRAGFRPLSRQVRAGRVTYELMTLAVNEDHSKTISPLIGYQNRINWNLSGISFCRQPPVYHGGAFFEAIGEEFDDLSRRNDVISADVLDAWFEPAPGVIEALGDNLAWSLKTSPPTGCEGMRRVIARQHGVGEENILPGAGSSDLIFLAFREWLVPSSRALILDPMYGEYAHVLEKVVRCQVDRLVLSADQNYALQPDELTERLRHGYDLVVIVNPNSPTGQHLPREILQSVLDSAPQSTRFWIDETYVDYAGGSQSLERFAARSSNVVVCKSMSKVYALSGVRAGYLCGPAQIVDELRPNSPPWAVSLPGQIAACEALKNPAYYQQKWQETHQLRAELAQGLIALGWTVYPSCANFLLCQLPASQPTAMELAAKCRAQKLFIRDVSSMGVSFDGRNIRIAVKDGRTNAEMLRILGKVLGNSSAETVQVEETRQ